MGRGPPWPEGGSVPSLTPAVPCGGRRAPFSHVVPTASVSKLPSHEDACHAEAGTCPRGTLLWSSVVTAAGPFPVRSHSEALGAGLHVRIWGGSTVTGWFSSNLAPCQGAV